MNERLRQGMASILGELETLFNNDEIGAVQINIVRRDGNVRSLYSYDDGFRIMLIAAATIGQQEAVKAAGIEHDPDGWHEASPPHRGEPA